MIITFFLYDGVTALDVIGPYEALSRIENVDIRFAARWVGEVKTDTPFLKLHSNLRLGQIASSDVLIIPGSTITFLEVIQDRQVLNWITKIDSTTKYTATVCTGSIILAATGLLEGHTATSHWYPKRFLSEYGVKTTDERVVTSGKYITSAGVSAGLDMSLLLLEKITSREFAETIQLMMEYAPKPHLNQGNYMQAEKNIVALAKKKLREEATRSGNLSII